MFAFIMSFGGLAVPMAVTVVGLLAAVDE